MDFLTIIENMIIFFNSDVVMRLVFPLVLILLIFDIISYICAKENKKGDIIDSSKSKILGLVLIVLLPVILTWFVGFIEKSSENTAQIDTSILDKIQEEETDTQSKDGKTSYNIKTNTITYT